MFRGNGQIKDFLEYRLNRSLKIAENSTLDTLMHSCGLPLFFPIFGILL